MKKTVGIPRSINNIINSVEFFKTRKLNKNILPIVSSFSTLLIPYPKLANKTNKKPDNSLKPSKTNDTRNPKKNL